MKKDGEPEAAAPKLGAARAEAPARKAATAPAPRTPSPGAMEIRPEAVLGAFKSAALVMPVDDENELELPTYFSPFAADSDKVVFKRPPATPAFLKRIRSDAPQESALEPMARAIRADESPMVIEAAGAVAAPAEEEIPLPELDLESVQDEDFDARLTERIEELVTASPSAPAREAEEDSPPPASGGSSFRRKQKLMGAGVLLIGIGLGLLVLRPQPHVPEPEPEPIPAFVPKPAAFVPVKPAPVVPPPAPAPVVPTPTELAAAQAPAAAPAPAAQPAAKRVPSGFWIVTVTGGKTSLRAGPGKQFKVLGEVEVGSRWKVRKWDGEWFQVEPENLGPETLGIGWIRNDLVKPEGNGGAS